MVDYIDTIIPGISVRVTTSPPTSATYEGLLYTADPITNLIVLSIAPSSPAATPTSASSPNPPTTTSSPTNTFKILPIGSLTSFTILSLPTPNNASTDDTRPNLPPPTALDMSSLNQRLILTITRLKTQDAKRGRGVTREAQDIFDGISRTYQARWMGTAMVVNDNVVIEPPYHIEDCRLLSAKERGLGEDNSGGDGGGSAEQSLLRIRMVLGMEREKLALRRGLGLGKNRGMGVQRKGG